MGVVEVRVAEAVLAEEVIPQQEVPSQQIQSAICDYMTNDHAKIAFQLVMGVCYVDE